VGSAVTVTANGSYNASTSYTPTVAGTYWWYATYGGDTYNAPTNSGCSATSTVVHLAVSPTSLSSATVYAAYSATIAASGGTSPYAFAVTSGSLPSGISLSSAGSLSGTDSASGQAGSYSFTVTATDHAGLTGSANYTLVVAAPTITLSSLTNPTGETSDTQSVTASGGQASYSYVVTSGSLPTGLSLSSAGAFSGSPSAAGTFGFTITATDAHSYTGSQSYSLTPVAPTFTLTPSTLPTATIYTAYSQALTTSGGVSAYSYSETGTLPSGITLSSAGVLSGTDSAASQAGSYPVTVTSTDADGFSRTKSYTLVVGAPTITLSSLANPTGETTYSQLASASGGQASYTYALTSGTLPTGLNLNTSTGGFTGTETAPGTFGFTITATDAHGYTGSQSYSLTPGAPTFTFSPSTLSSATVYTAYSQALTTSGGVSAYSYSETGTLPSGITLSSAGVLSGTDSAASQAGSYPITVTSTDADGFSGTQSYTLVVGAPTILLSSLTNPTGEASDTQSVTASGGQAGYAYAKTSGSLPTGLSFSSAGAFSGSPSAAGTFSFTITATDAHGYTGSQSYSLTPVAPTFTFGPTSLPSATPYIAYSQTLTTSGGVSAYGYSETGTLPSGITLSTAGVLSGTISASGLAGSYPITVTSTDADGFSGTKSYTLVVSSSTSAITITPSTLPAASPYVAYSQTLTSSGGTTAYGYTETGSLPTGLSLSSGGVLSGTISASGQAGSYPITVTSTEAHGYTDSISYTLVVSSSTSAITLSALSPTTTIATKSYTSGAISVSGGTGTDTFAVSSGALPSGVTLTTSGANAVKLTGTPAAVSVSTVYSFTITATDSNSYTGSQAYSLTVVPVLTGTSIGTGSCSLVTVSSCSSGSVTTASGDTELVLIYTTGLLTPTISSVSGPFNANATLVTSQSFTTGATGNNLYVYQATGSGSTAAVSANFAASLLSTTAIEVVQLTGNNTSASITQHTGATGTSSPITSTFGTSPASFDGEVVFFATPTGGVTLTPAATGTFGSGLTMGFTVIDPAATSQSFTMSTSGAWGSIGMEFPHN
jgi:hypothetical protein